MSIDSDLRECENRGMDIIDILHSARCEVRELEEENAILRGYIQSVIDWNDDKSITMEQFCEKLGEARALLGATK